MAPHFFSGYNPVTVVYGEGGIWSLFLPLFRKPRDFWNSIPVTSYSSPKALAGLEWGWATIWKAQKRSFFFQFFGLDHQERCWSQGKIAFTITAFTCDIDHFYNTDQSRSWLVPNHVHCLPTACKSRSKNWDGSAWRGMFCNQSWWLDCKLERTWVSKKKLRKRQGIHLVTGQYLKGGPKYLQYKGLFK